MSTTWPRPLGQQIALIVATCLLLVTVTFGWYLSNQQTESAKEIKLRETRALATNIATSAIVLLQFNNYVAIEELLRRSGGFPDVQQLSVADADGLVLSEVVREQQNTLQAVYQKKHINLPDTTHHHSHFRDNHFVIWMPLKQGMEILGWVKVKVSTDFLEQVYGRILRQTTVAGVLLFLLSLLVIHFALKRKITSLSQATDFATALAESPGATMPVMHASEELDNLSVALNKTSLRLKDQDQQIKQQYNTIRSNYLQLQERVKELHCIYTISRVLSDTKTSIQDKLSLVVDAIPPSWQFPSETTARLLYENELFTSRLFVTSDNKQSVELHLQGKPVGKLEVFYTGTLPPPHFLPEEQMLLDEIGNRLENYFEAYQDRQKLQSSHETLEEKVALRTKELEQAKQQAEEANRAKTLFLSRMSHELRTPLNAILGFTQLMQIESRDSSAAQLEYVTEIRHAGDHLMTLINEILELSRIDSGKIKVHRKTMGIREKMQECLKLIEPIVDKKHIRTVLLGDEMQVLADPLRVKQVFINILSNAVKYNKNNGSIFVKISAAENDRVAVAVTDTGVGIDRENINTIFEPFQRVEPDHVTEGTGIGLAVSQTLMELMSGEIQVSSTPGKGSTFTLLFQRSEEHVQHSQQPEAV